MKKGDLKNEEILDYLDYISFILMQWKCLCSGECTFAKSQ